MNNPKVSIIVPVYGVEKYLNQCLESLLGQTLQEIEIILVNDGSPDRCPQIVDEYVAKDSRVIAIHKPNGGYGSACNVGFERATGEYVAIVEPDDFIDCDMYEQLYKRAKENDCDVVKSAFYTYYDVVGQRPRDKKCNWYPQEKRRKKHICWEMPSGIFTIYEHPEFFYFHPSVWSCIYHRDFIVQHKIRMEELPGASWTDNLFQVQTLCLAKSIAYIDKAFYHWRLQHNDDAKDLKDLTIPFLRTRTIHAWLRENNIAVENLWACLYKREFTYIQLVLRAVKFGQLRGLRLMFREMLKDMTHEIMRGNKYITSKERRLHCRIQRYYLCYYFYCKVRNILKTLTGVMRGDTIFM